MDCRTPAMGSILCSCDYCGYSFEIYKSCGNRHCPTCQGEKANDWLSKRLDQMLPVHHFMITFTAPVPFREFFRSHQSFAYNIFKALPISTKTNTPSSTAVSASRGSPRWWKSLFSAASGQNRPIASGAGRPRLTQLR